MTPLGLELHPVVEVPHAEYLRLLGYPRHHTLEGRARELAEWAISWYAANGRPWIFTRLAEPVEIGGASILLEGERFHSGVLRRRWQHASADGAVLAAVSAGPELEREAGRLWEDERPDEYYFLEVLGSAVVEHLAALAGQQLCGWAEGRGLAVLPHYSPGYPGWDIAEQPRLLDVITRGAALPGELEALDTGALRPKKSLLAVFGLTRRTEGVRRLSEVPLCSTCSLATCQFRRETGDS
jgi:hypothetical protein